MQAQKDRLQQLCEQVLVEKDPERFRSLVDEFNRLLGGNGQQPSKKEAIQQKPP
jgi:hypothetical protein